MMDDEARHYLVDNWLFETIVFHFVIGLEVTHGIHK